MQQICLNCNHLHNNPRFCSKSCAASYNNKLREPRSIESRLKTSRALSGRKHPAAKNPLYHPKYCVIKLHKCKVDDCNQIISNPYRLTCSINCRDSIRSKNGTLKRRIDYNGKTFQSSWEVEIAKFLDHHGINWDQPKKRLSWYDTTLNKTRTYLPDFILLDTGTYLDVKNPIKQLQEADKISQLIKQFKLYIGDIPYIKSCVVATEGLEPPAI